MSKKVSLSLMVVILMASLMACDGTSLFPTATPTAMPTVTTGPALALPPSTSTDLSTQQDRFTAIYQQSSPGVVTVLTTTNPSLPLSNWTVAGPATNTTPGVFQFSTDTTNNPQGYYRVRSP